MRLTDPAIWDKPWFRKLKPIEKCAFRFLLDKCDNAGVWTCDFEAAEFYIGGKIDWESFVEKVNGNIMVLESGKWWLKDFVVFQCRRVIVEESARDNATKSYIGALKKHGLYEEYLNIHSDLIRGSSAPDQGLRRGCPAPLNKDKDKDKDKDKESYAEAVTMTPAQYTKLVERFGKAVTRRAIEKLSAYKLSKGKRYKSDYHAILQWVIEAVGGQELVKPKAPKVCPNGHQYIGSCCTKCGWSESEEKYGPLQS